MATSVAALTLQAGDTLIALGSHEQVSTLAAIARTPSIKR